MKITAELDYEKAAPKSHAYGTRTEDGVLIKVWIPKALLGKKPAATLDVEVDIPTGSNGKKNKKSKKRVIEEDEDEDEDEDDEEEE